LFEDLFTRLIDQRVEATPALIELVGAAVAVLPALVEQIESGAEPGVDLGPLRRAATAEPGGIPGGLGRVVLAGTAARELAILHRWLDAVAEGKGSGQVPQAVFEALETLARCAETLGNEKVLAGLKSLSECLSGVSGSDSDRLGEIASALEALETMVGPRESAEGLDAASVEAYREEAQALLERISVACDALLVDAADADAVLTMQRELHTLKGASRVAGFRAFSDVAHSLEDLLKAIALEKVVVTPRVLWSLQRVLDSMYGMLDPGSADRAGKRAVAIIEELRKIAGGEQGAPVKSSDADRRRKPRVVADVERVRSDQFDRALVRALSLGLRSMELDARMREQTMWDMASIAEVLKELGDG
ncbi:MAG TPA: Hpt domain-containing protein, partial [Gammaproteobacteria bacterium]|nr:Hpt domain-containing protein [Gammaproteobacteria bacterium]